MLDKRIKILLLTVIILLIFYKERDEYGCTGVLQCFASETDENNKYVKASKYNNKDTIKDIERKLLYITNIHQKIVVWRKSILISVILIFIVSLIDHRKHLDIDQYIIMLIVFSSIMYFFQNFINYHLYSSLRLNSEELIKQIDIKCFQFQNNFN